MGSTHGYMPQLSDIEELRRKINNIRPSMAESIEYINQELAMPFIYNCNALSGSKASKETTRRIMAEGPSEDEKSMKSAYEITGLKIAYNCIQDLNEKILSVKDLQDLHRHLQSKIDFESAGVIKTSSEINYAQEIKEYVNWFNNNYLDTITFASEAYWRYLFMHPFKGSNGRMARLLMNLAFLRRDFTTVIIPVKWKSDYDAIINSNDNSLFAPFIRRCIFFSQNLIINKEGTVYSDKKKRHIRGLDVEEDVLEYIQKNPGCKAVVVKKSFPKISFTKLQRVFRNLSQQEKIEFRGPTKTGGYYAK